jgi:protein TonB
MHFTHAQSASGNTSTRLALVIALHVIIGIAFIKTMHVRTLSLPSMPKPVELVRLVDPPATPPPPAALPVASLPAPAIVVPAVEVPLSTPPVQDQVATTTTISDPSPFQAPATTTSTQPVAQARDAGAAPTLRAASMLEGCARPAYPAQAARDGASGTVTLALLVGVDGRVTGARVQRSSGVRELDKAALTALAQCRFQPAMRGDVAQAGWALVAYDWKLE